MTDVSVLVALSAVAGTDSGPVFDDLVGRAGVPSVVWGALSHQPAFWSVRGTGRRLAGAQPGAACFQPDAALWSGLRLRPRAAAAIGRRDPLARAGAEATRLGLAGHVRVSLLHNPPLATGHPECAQRDVAGRPHPWALCPSHPDVHAYTETLMADLARYGPASVRLDWAHFAGVPSPRPAGHRPDSAVCFCRHCRSALESWCDVDAAVHEARVAAGIERPDEPDGDAWWPGTVECAAPPPSPLRLYRDALRHPVSALAERAANAAHAHGVRVLFTLPHRTSHHDTGAEAQTLAGVVDGLQSPQVGLHRQSVWYASPGGRGTVCLYPERGHWNRADDPEPSLTYARRGSIAEVELQHYHAMPDDFLDRVGDVLMSLPGTVS